MPAWVDSWNHLICPDDRPYLQALFFCCQRQQFGCKCWNRSLDRSAVQRLALSRQRCLDGRGDGVSAGQNPLERRRCLAVFLLHCLRAVAFLGDQFPLRSQVVLQQSLQCPNLIQQVSSPPALSRRSIVAGAIFNSPPSDR